jgi:hypothetical protein
LFLETTMLNHSQARTIAEGCWGRGGTSAEPTNRPGAYYFSTSGHGGFVIDARALTDEELVAISPYVTLEDATLYKWGNHRKLKHPYRTKGFKASFCAELEHFKFFLLEEDCDWCLAYLFTGIRHKNNPPTIEAAQRTFDEWIAPRKQA